MQRKKLTRLIVLMVVLALAVAPMALMAGCEKAGGSASPSPTASPTPSEAPVEYGPYKDVLIMADFPTGSQLQPYAYSLHLRDDITHEGIRINGEIDSGWGAMRPVYDPLCTDPDKIGARYFTTNLKDADVIDNAKTLALIEKGDLPWIAHTPNIQDIGIPNTIKKVIIVAPYKDLAENKIEEGGINGAWVDDWNGPGRTIKVLIKQLKYRFPDAEIYLTSFLPWPKDMGLINKEKWPMSGFNRGNKQITNPDDDKTYSSYWAGMQNSNIPEADEKVKAIADAFNVTFVDLAKSALVGDDGFRKEEYAHPQGSGNELSQSGLTLLGDILMEAAGLPKPDEQFPDWYAADPIR